MVIDGGANVGGFSRGMVDRFGCLCYAVEPVPELFARIPEDPRVRRFPLALGGGDGEVVLHLSGNPEANSADPAIAAGFGSRGTLVASLASLESFLTRAGLDGADLLKLDIEGSEIALLENAGEATLRRIGQITVEFHDFLDDSRDAPRSRPSSGAWVGPASPASSSPIRPATTRTPCSSTCGATLSARSGASTSF